MIFAMKDFTETGDIVLKKLTNVPRASTNARSMRIAPTFRRDTNAFATRDMWATDTSARFRWTSVLWERTTATNTPLAPIYPMDSRANAAPKR